MSDLFYKTAFELSDLLERREISAEDLLRAVVGRAEAVENTVGAFLSRDVDDAIRYARRSDERRSRGETRSALDGIPVSLKDIIAVRNQPLTCGSRILKDFVAPYDATVTEKLRDAGAVLWGRLNLDEFAMGSSTENSAYQVTRNPWNPAFIPGGSSGGSAAAVAAGETILALGSDTGGSVRQPASLCGVVGMKPTYGRISRYGLVAFASSLDQIGPLGRTVEDVALLLGAISGFDCRDSTSLREPVPDYTNEGLASREGGWKLGLPREYLGEGLDADVRTSLTAVVEEYRAGGCEIVDLSLPHANLSVPVYYIIATAEASSNLARYDGVRYTRRSARARDHLDMYFKSRGEGFGDEVKRRVILGTYVLSSGYYDAYYLRAQKARTLIRRDFTEAFKEVDAIIAPTAPTPAFKIGDHIDDPLTMYLGDIYTLSVNLAGLPGIAVPCGFSTQGLPIGFQLIGPPMEEGKLIAIAEQYDRPHRYGCGRPPC